MRKKTGDKNNENQEKNKNEKMRTNKKSLEKWKPGRKLGQMKNKENLNFGKKKGEIK